MDLSKQKELQSALESGLVQQYGKGVSGLNGFMRNVAKYGLGATIGGALAVGTSANAAIDVSGVVDSFVTDGTTAITAIGVGLITLAGIAIVFKWVKAAFFS